MVDLVDREWKLVFEKDFGTSKAVEAFSLDRDPEIIEGKRFMIGKAVVKGVTCAIKLEDDRILTKCEECDEEKQPCFHVKVFWHKHMRSIYVSRLPMPAERKKEIFRGEKGEAEAGKGADQGIEADKDVGEVSSEVSETEEKLVMIMDKLDEEMMKKIDLTWLASDEYPLIYEFERTRKLKDGSVKKETVRQLTWAGWILAARKQGDIRVEPAEFVKLEDGTLMAIALATDLKTNLTMPGQSTKVYGKNYTYEVLASKAVRNALKKVIDPLIVEQVIEYAKRRKAIKQIDLREATTP